MKIEKPTSEPSMDEILASIRHIISGDSQEEKKDPLGLRDSDDILDLTEVLPEVSQKMENLETGMKVDLPLKASNCQKNETARPLKEPDPFTEPLVSSATISEAAQALHSLNKFASESPRCPDPRLNEGMGGQTVENLVREILRPLLKEWLDANLPTLVRWVVNEQVERIVRQVNAVQHEPIPGKEKFYSKS